MARPIRQGRKLWIYIVLAVGVAAAIELSAAIPASYLAGRGALYDPSSITQSYADYLKVRDPTLGWKARDEGRTDPAYAASSPACVSMFGDSFTFSSGEDIQDKDAWPAILSRQLKCHVVNYGVGGYGTDQSYLRFRSLPAKGDIVVLNHLSENILRNVNQFRNLLYPGAEFAFKPRFIVSQGKLQLVPLPDVPPSDIHDFLETPGRYLQHEYFLPGGPSGIQEFKRPYTLALTKVVLDNYHLHAKLLWTPRHATFYAQDHPSNGLAVTFAILSAFVRDAEAQRQTPVVTIIPTCEDLEYAQRTGRLPYASLTDLIQQNGFNFIDFGAEMIERLDSSSPSRLYSSCSAHLNRDGYRWLAEIALPHLGELQAFVRRRSD